MSNAQELFTAEHPSILISVDGSSFSEFAAQTGIELARRLNAKVILLSVIDLSNIVGNASVGGIIDAEILNIYHEEAQKVVDNIVKKYPYENITTMTQEGIPSETILRMAAGNKVDMIIMGTHGRTGLRHLFMGSVAEYVIRHSHLPVLVIPMSNAK